MIKNSPHTKPIVFLLGIAFFLEIFFFNFNSYRLYLGDFTEKRIPLDQVEQSGFWYNPETGYLESQDGSDSYTLELLNLNQPVGSVYIDFQAPEGVKAHGFALAYTDLSNARYVSTEMRDLADNVEKTKYFTCWFHGSSNSIEITSASTPVVVKEIVINKKVPFSFDFARFFLVAGLFLFVYLLLRASIFSCPIRDIGWRQKTVSWFFRLLLAGLFLFTVYTSLEEKSIGLPAGDLYSQDLTDAFLHKQFHLLTQPDEALAQMKNPYDMRAREDAGVYADWQYRLDCSYYNGRYYCYFGPVPSLLLFVPYTLATGQYLQTGWACLLFGLLAALYMGKLLTLLMRRFLPDLPYRLLLLGELLLVFSSGILWNLRRPMFYELSILASCAFLMMGFYYIALAIKKDKLIKPTLAFGCLCMALAVGCRPLSLLYSLLLIPVLWAQYKKYRTDKKQVWKTALSVALPFVTVGGLLMYYNYARFGSITEFGVTYQLTSIDMNGEAFKPQILPICIWLSWFAPPLINSKFPFVYGDMYGALNFIGIFARQKTEIGVFFLNPLLWCLLSPSVWKEAAKRYGKKARNFILLTTIVTVLLFLFMSSTGGVAVRYSTDYVVAFSFAAIFLYSALYTAAREKGLEGLYTKVILAAVLIAVFLGLTRSLAGEGNLLWRYHPDLFLYLERAFAFWM